MQGQLQNLASFDQPLCKPPLPPLPPKRMHRTSTERPRSDVITGFKRRPSHLLRRQTGASLPELSEEVQRAISSTVAKYLETSAREKEEEELATVEEASAIGRKFFPTPDPHESRPRHHMRR